MAAAVTFVRCTDTSTRPSFPRNHSWMPDKATTVDETCLERTISTLRRERCGRCAGWRCARAGDSVTISVVLVAWAARVAVRAGGGRCTAPAARGASGADRIGRRSESEGGHLLAARLGGGADGGATAHRCGLALRREGGHVKIRNQDFDSRNSKLRWQGTGKSSQSKME